MTAALDVILSATGGDFDQQVIVPTVLFSQCAILVRNLLILNKTQIYFFSNLFVTVSQAT